VRKKLLLVVMLMGLLSLPALAAAQNARIVVWHALAKDDTAVLVQAADAFQEQTGVTVEFRYVQPPLLYETVASAAQSGGTGPDVIIADNNIMQPLIDKELITPARSSGTFFLADLLNNLPALVDKRCPDTSITSCLWPRVTPVLPVPVLDDTVVTRTTDWLCESSAWLPFCRGGGLSGVAISWGFNVYLVNTTWTAQQGIEPPANAEDIQKMRSDYGLNIVEAKPGDIPTVSAADSPPVYLIPSGLIVEDPNGVMRSMGSFYDAGYIAVIEMRMDAAYIVTESANTGQAEDFVAFLQSNADAQAALVDSSQRFPAFDADTLSARRDTPAGLATLQALVTLATYAALAY
jgi:hypothetical protein